jgi:hypothetical protein
MKTQVSTSALESLQKMVEKLDADNKMLLEALEDVMDRLVDRHETDESAIKARLAIAKAENKELDPEPPSDEWKREYECNRER